MNDSCLEELVRRDDDLKKTKMKSREDKKNKAASETGKRIGDYVILEDKVIEKITSIYDPKPYKVVTRKGPMVTAKRREWKVTRDSSRVKPVTFDKLNDPANDEDEDDADSSPNHTPKTKNPSSDNITIVDELKKFLRKKKTTVSHARGILVGCADAGKTTLLKRLRGQPQNVGEDTKSTRGLEVHQHLFIVRNRLLEVIDDDSPLKTFIRVNAADLKPDPSSTTDISDSNENRDNLDLKSTDKNTKVIFRREENKEANVELSNSQIKSKEEENTVEKMASVLSSEAQAMVKDEIFQKILSEKEKLPTVSMLDFAGQLAYYACHQIYVTPKAFFILVLDMTKRFEDVVSKEKDNQEGSIFSVWTYKDYLKFWITSIKTFGGTKSPLFIVVTHIEGKSTNEIEKYFEEFWKTVPDEDRDWLSESLNDREYAVGLVELNEKSKEMLESMKTSIVELFTDEINTKIEMPSSWALMEQLLYDGAWKVLSLGEIKRLNSSLPIEYQIKSNEEISRFLKCFHDNGLLLYFEEDRLKEHAVIDIQWFADAFSKIIADENHINKDCKRRLIKQWKSFNKTGELQDKVVEALWKDEPSYLKHKSEIMSYMEKLQMLVPLKSFGAVSDGGMSWYVPCMNKKLFKADFCEDKWECSSILCYRFTSFAMFVFYRLVAHCISFLRWSVSIDEDSEGSPCLYQTAAVFDHKEHTVVVGIYDDDIQLQVLRITPLTVDKDISNEIGKYIEKAIEKLTETFIGTKIFHKGYKCQNIICNEKDSSFTLASELSKIKTDKEIQCRCRLQEKHVINIQRTLSFWEKEQQAASKSVEESVPSTELILNAVSRKLHGISSSLVLAHAFGVHMKETANVEEDRFRILYKWKCKSSTENHLEELERILREAGDGEAADYVGTFQVSDFECSEISTPSQPVSESEFDMLKENLSKDYTHLVRFLGLPHICIEQLEEDVPFVKERMHKSFLKLQERRPNLSRQDICRGLTFIERSDVIDLLNKQWKSK
ncbi:uncharacterized protein LOC133203461 [Saccostrea echinata]|uniref:uncharacterized protein LOC133203461 n=1 Tax=Saccostrea echinata TaxID=191078 RepID=UPI002A7F8E0E|nr:uncharacterized protein LOC133203461 [Saccostrea echinata]